MSITGFTQHSLTMRTFSTFTIHPNYYYNYKLSFTPQGYP